MKTGMLFFSLEHAGELAFFISKILILILQFQSFCIALTWPQVFHFKLTLQMIFSLYPSLNANCVCYQSYFITNVLSLWHLA